MGATSPQDKNLAILASAVPALVSGSQDGLVRRYQTFCAEESRFENGV